jgi:hypothetical protein
LTKLLALFEQALSPSKKKKKKKKITTSLAKQNLSSTNTMPLPLFAVSLHSDTNNKKIFGITNLLHLPVPIE